MTGEEGEMIIVDDPGYDPKQVGEDWWDSVMKTRKKRIEKEEYVLIVDDPNERLKDLKITPGTLVIHEEEINPKLREAAIEYLQDPEIESALDVLLEKGMNPDEIAEAALVHDMIESGDYDC